METLELSRAELWFCAPDTPAVGEARVFELKTGKGVRPVWMREVRSVLPPLQNGRVAYELFTQEETRRGLSCVLWREGTQFSIEAEREDEVMWRRNIGKRLAGRTSRIWRPKNDDRFAVALFETGQAVVLGCTESRTHFSSTGFHWSQETSFDNFFWWPNDEFDSYFARQFTDEKSPLRLAYDWHGLSHDERTAHALRCKVGTWEEMRALAESVLVLTHREVEDFDWDYEYWNPLFPDRFDPDSDILSPWSDVLGRVFLPSCLREDAPLHEPSHLGGLSQLYPTRPRSQPSAHEKLEAFLQLRDWLRQHAPDDEERLMGLFPPLSA